MFFLSSFSTFSLGCIAAAYYFHIESYRVSNLYFGWTDQRAGFHNKLYFNSWTVNSEQYIERSQKQMN